MAHTSDTRDATSPLSATAVVLWWIATISLLSLTTIVHFYPVREMETPLFLLRMLQYLCSSVGTIAAVIGFFSAEGRAKAAAGIIIVLPVIGGAWLWVLNREFQTASSYRIVYDAIHLTLLLTATTLVIKHRSFMSEPRI